MKKIYVLLLGCFLNVSNAQVPNSGFENALGYGLEQVANWGQFFPVSVTINEETGQTTFDEIIYEPDAVGTFCTSVTDAYSGERAMKIRNAFNATQNFVIPGKASLFNSEISDLPTGWNTGVPVAPDAQIQFFGFWYKFSPLGNDIAEAKLELFNAGGESVGKSVITISGTNTDLFNYVYMPVQFTSQEAPAFMTIDFSMAQDGSTPVFGSSLIVDEVRVNFLPLGINEHPADLFTVYPTLADSQINIVKNAHTENGIFNMSIIDANGKTVKQQPLEISDSPSQMDVSLLASGVYFLKIQSGKTTSVTRFIKK